MKFINTGYQIKIIAFAIYDINFFQTTHLYINRCLTQKDLKT